MNNPVHVIVLIGAGSIGQAIARRVSAGKHVLISDIDLGKAEVAAKIFIDAGFNVSTARVDVASRKSVDELVEKAVSIGKISGLIHAAGVSPSQASVKTILEVDLLGTASVLEAFGTVVEKGCSGVIISSQSGHRLPALSIEEDRLLALTPSEELLELSLLKVENINDSLHAYQLSKRANSLRVRAEAVRWGKRGARINAISPGIIITPLANDELAGSRGDLYRKMIQTSPVGRAGTPDEVGSVASFLMGQDGTFITGSDVLMDGGVTAHFFYGE
jgi:NAD(P)-dependent dehydrogenase (short-subunit alcohol dehydrogenase family)